MKNPVHALYAWACERLYHEFAWSYDAVAAMVSAGQWDAWRALSLEHVRGPRVLELGFGTGVLLRELTAAGYAVCGVDASSTMQQIARRRLPSADNGPRLVQARGQQLPWADGIFSTVVATFPAPYILDPTTLAECARVLPRPGGRLVISGLWIEPAALDLAGWPSIFYGKPSPDFLATVRTRLAAAGFTAQIGAPRVGWANVGLVIAELADPLKPKAHDPTHAG